MDETRCQQSPGRKDSIIEIVNDRAFVNFWGKIVIAGSGMRVRKGTSDHFKRVIVGGEGRIQYSILAWFLEKIELLAMKSHEDRDSTKSKEEPKRKSVDRPRSESFRIPLRPM
jgi:hypothetical protein